MLAKAGVDLLSSFSTELITEPLAYVLILSVPIGALIQLRLMAKMFSSFEAVLIVPVFQSIFIFGLILEGAFYFQDFIGISSINLAFFFVSIIMCVVGMFMLAR